MSTITLNEVQADPVGTFRRVEAGESLVVYRGEHPVAEIKPVPAENRELRPYGLAAGEFTVPDDFDDPLPEEILQLFEGKGGSDLL